MNTHEELRGTMDNIRIKTKYINEMARVEFGRYIDKSIGITLHAVGTLPEPLCKATICLAERRRTPKDGYILIKDYSENEGIYEALLEAGIVERSDGYINVSYPGTSVYVCKLTQKSLDEIKAQGV